MYFDDYMDGVQELLKIVQDLEDICIQMPKITDIKKLNYTYNHDCDQLFRNAKWAVHRIKENDYTDYHDYNNNDVQITEYKKRCKTMKKDVEKIKERYKEYEELCIKTYADTLQNLVLGKNAEYIIMDNDRLRLVVEKLKAEAIIKEAEIKKHEVVIATKNTEKAKAKLAIEKEKTEQIRLQVEERKARLQGYIACNIRQ